MRTVSLMITAGIAAYKAIELIRLLRKGDYRIVPIVTESAKKFVTPLTLEAIAEHPVYDALFAAGQESSIGHIQLARQSDLVVVAPCSADFMAKFALGFADDLPSTLLLANTAPVLLAPAMNHRMWQAGSTQAHVQTLLQRGVQYIGPNEGEMACGEYGVGRMAEPSEIFTAIEQYLTTAPQAKPLQGRRVLITGGGTREAIDPVRYMTNRSSGKMAKAIVRALVQAGAEVTFVHGPIADAQVSGAQSLGVETACQMDAAVQAQVGYDVFIGAAAVADWRVGESATKLKKTATGTPNLILIENPDILARVAKQIPRPPLVIGFAAETQHDPVQVEAKLHRKGCDWLLENVICADNPAFDQDENALFFYAYDGEQVQITDWGHGKKQWLAQKLVQAIAQHFQEAE